VAEAELGRGRREEGFRGRGKNGRNGWEGMEEIDGTNFFFLTAVCSFLSTAISHP
jgi:hypothetical protein